MASLTGSSIDFQISLDIRKSLISKTHLTFSAKPVLIFSENGIVLSLVAWYISIGTGFLDMCYFLTWFTR